MINKFKFMGSLDEFLDPFTVYSGTEYMAPLLYSLVRMTRPQKVVEIGSGYTTLFMLNALADNIKQIQEERKALRAKTALLGDLEAIKFDNEESKPLIEEWIQGKGAACHVDPKFYLNEYDPSFLCFDALPSEHPHVQAVHKAIDKMGIPNILEYINGNRFTVDQLRNGYFPIDLVFIDTDNYKHIFSEFWPRMNAAGGMMIFHNVTGNADWWSDVEWMKDSRKAENDIEVLILEEPHKFNQNGCAILRKTNAFRPSFQFTTPVNILTNLKSFMDAS